MSLGMFLWLQWLHLILSCSLRLQNYSLLFSRFNFALRSYVLMPALENWWLYWWLWDELTVTGTLFLLSPCTWRRIAAQLMTEARMVKHAKENLLVGNLHDPMQHTNQLHIRRCWQGKLAPKQIKAGDSLFPSFRFDFCARLYLELLVFDFFSMQRSVSQRPLVALLGERWQASNHKLCHKQCGGAPAQSAMLWLRKAMGQGNLYGFFQGQTTFLALLHLSVTFLCQIITLK